MQRTLVYALFVCSTSITFAQVHRTGLVAERINTLRSAGAEFITVPLFSSRERSAVNDALWSQAVATADVVRLESGAAHGLLGTRAERISLELPAGERQLILDLELVDITTDDFDVIVASTGASAGVSEGSHYRGSIRGVEGSLAAISIFPDEVMGLISDDEGEWVLGRFANDTQGDHVLYRERDLLATPGHACGTPDVDMGEGSLDDEGALTDRTVKCVRLYWEVNYDIFQGKGSVTNAVNYVTGLFNQSAILYANDGISVSLSQVHVWDVPSPYTSTSTSTQLSTFGTTRTSFNGDLAHLLGYSGGGGVAWVNSLCNSQTRYRMAYSDVNSTYQNVPTYSWSVDVVTHEQGHNMGSKHTHACAWNGNNTAIDGCGPAAGYSEGSCASGPVPSSSVGGTIMSYCHLTSAGIKFSNGFGPQPAALIVSRINSSNCLSNCTASSCDAPTALVVSNISSTGAALSWTGASGVSSYTLQWKPTSISTWTTVSGLNTTSYSLSGLSAGTDYQFQVATVCAASTSPYAAPVQFATPSSTCGVPSNLVASALTSSSATLTWGIVAAAASYDLQWKASSSSSWTTVVGLASNSYAVNGLSAGIVHQFQVRSVCSSGGSAYSTPANFTTPPLTCSDFFEPNDSRNSARIAPVNSTITGRIAHRYDQDWFKFGNSISARNIRVRLTGLPANYAVTLYRGGTVVGSSNVGGTGNEQIVLNNAAVASDYTVRVSGVSGSYNASLCYTLVITTAATGFMFEEQPAGFVEADQVEEQPMEMFLFPNPATDEVRVGLDAFDGPTTIELIDALGQQVWSTVKAADPISGMVEFSVQGRPTGVYFVRVLREGRSTVQRLIVAH